MSVFLNAALRLIRTWGILWLSLNLFFLFSCPLLFQVLLSVNKLLFAVRIILITFESIITRAIRMLAIKPRTFALLSQPSKDFIQTFISVPFSFLLFLVFFSLGLVHFLTFYPWFSKFFLYLYLFLLLSSFLSLLPFSLSVFSLFYIGNPFFLPSFFHPRAHSVGNQKSLCYLHIITSSCNQQREDS